jgi:hypothetical protein
MLRDSLYFDEHFWKTMEFIESLEHEIAINDLFGHFDMSKDDVDQILLFLESFGYEIKYCEIKMTKCLYPPDSGSNVGSLEKISSSQVENILKTTEKEAEQAKEVAELENNYTDLVHKLEKALKSEHICEFKLEDGLETSTYLHKIVYLEGMLSIIGEDINTKQIIAFGAHEIQDFETVEKHSYVRNFSSVEIDDFISAMRAIDGIEERLVLKVSSKLEGDITPKYIHLGKPFVTSNMEGDRIWVAHVEPSDELFEWLVALQDHVEIVDPASIKWGVLKYCEEKLKKAS